jgi:hypothetical protein
MPKKPAPDLIQGGNRFPEKDHAQSNNEIVTASGHRQ